MLAHSAGLERVGVDPSVRLQLGRVCGGISARDLYLPGGFHYLPGQFDARPDRGLGSHARSRREREGPVEPWDLNQVFGFGRLRSVSRRVPPLTEFDRIYRCFASHRLILPFIQGPR